MRRFTAVCLATFALASSAVADGDETAIPSRRVILIVWDGLRPDSISEGTTPTLARLASEGTFFARHHAVYPTSTEVNGTAMMTGCYPGHSGLIANREYRPAIDPLRTIAMEDLKALRKGDEVSGGQYLRVPTLPELLQAHGTRTVITGTKAVTVLFDRTMRSEDDTLYQGKGTGSVVLSEGRTLPTELAMVLTGNAGSAFPEKPAYPNYFQDQWTTDALLGTLWPRFDDGPPRLTMLWMSDPDYTQHMHGPESPEAKNALADVDNKLAAVLAALEAKGLRASTDVMVVSDHGFSTIGRGVDFVWELRKGGFNATREYKAEPVPGEVLINGLGGSVFLYVAGHDTATIRHLVEYLQGTDFAGVIFTRDPLPGTFGLNVAHIASPDAPDVAVALRWSGDKAPGTELPGLLVSDGARVRGQGTHASLSHFDLHNTLIASGPDFKKGWRDESPSGNTDIGPTIAYLLGAEDHPKMDGRVLSESLVDWVNRSAPPAPVSERLEASEGKWKQYLQVTHFGGVDYFDEGNGG